MNKKLLIVLTLCALPFLSVWFAWILTALSFNIKEIFQSGDFWGISMLYWVMWLSTLGIQIELVNKIYNRKPTK